MMLRVWRYAYGGAKIMALKGRLLTAEDYHFLLRARALPDFAGYLATTAYAAVLAGWDWQTPVAEEDFSRRLWANLAASFHKVNKGLKERERCFITALAQRLTAENLKVILRALHRGIPPEAAQPLLIPLGKLSPLVFEELLEQGSVQALADYLTPTPWGPPLARGLPRYLREQSLFPLETSLDLWVFAFISQEVQHLSRPDRRLAGQLWGALADITNLIWFGRFKEIYGLPGEEIYQYLLEAGNFRQPRRRHDLAFAPDLATLPALLPYPYGDLLQGAADLPEVETRLSSFWTQTLGRVLIRPPFQIGLPIAYLFLKELEIHHLLTLLTGLILKIPSDRLAPWLQGRAAGGRYV